MKSLRITAPLFLVIFGLTLEFSASEADGQILRRGCHQRGISPRFGCRPKICFPRLRLPSRRQSYCPEPCPIVKGCPANSKCELVVVSTSDAYVSSNDCQNHTNCNCRIDITDSRFSSPTTIDFPCQSGLVGSMEDLAVKVAGAMSNEVTLYPKDPSQNVSNLKIAFKSGSKKLTLKISNPPDPSVIENPGTGSAITVTLQPTMGMPKTYRLNQGGSAAHKSAEYSVVLTYN